MTLFNRILRIKPWTNSIERRITIYVELCNQSCNTVARRKLNFPAWKLNTLNCTQVSRQHQSNQNKLGAFLQFLFYLKSLFASDSIILTMLSKWIKFSDRTAALWLVVIQCLAQGHFRRVDVVDVWQLTPVCLLRHHANLLYRSVLYRSVKQAKSAGR